MKPSANRVQVCNSSRVENVWLTSNFVYRRYLYGAVLDKGRSPVPSGKANKQASTLPGMFIVIHLYLPVQYCWTCQKRYTREPFREECFEAIQELNPRAHISE